MEYRSGGSRVRCIVLLCVVFTVCGVIYLGYFCPERVCALTSGHSQQPQGPQSVRFLIEDSSGLFLSSKKTSINNADKFEISSVEYENSGLGQQLNEAAGGKGDIGGGSSSSSSSFWPMKPTKTTVGVSFDDLVSNSSHFHFDILARDVIVFLHIQKTGGTTFGKHLVQDLDLDKPCNCHKNNLMSNIYNKHFKRCKCTRPNSDKSYWLFSRFSTGWMCGLHADWTELTGCVNSALNREEGRKTRRRLFYVTLLRDPVMRFLSEYLHVQRGATWKKARHWCAGHAATDAELPPCYEGEDWEDVSLDEFMDCPSNLAFNRQTRMLADLALVGCYNTTVLSRERRDSLMLASAKENLRKLAYFGLCEQQQMAQYMFEEVFRMNFLTAFQQFNETHVTSALNEITPMQLERIKELNYLDLQLLKYANELLNERFEKLKSRDRDFEAHYQGIGRPSVKYSPAFEENDSN